MENSNEAQIKQIIDKRIQAINNKNIKQLLANHAKDIQSFDIFKPMQYSGVDTLKERATNWFSSYKSSIGYDIKDLNITASDDVAFCHYIYHITGSLNEGEEVDMWVRCTICFNKIAGEWKIIHEHSSIPLDLP